MDKREFDRRQSIHKVNSSSGLSPHQIRLLIPSLQDLLKYSVIKSVIWYDRCSTRHRSKKKMKLRLNAARQILKELGIEIFSVYMETCSGYSSDIENRTELKRAVEESRSRNIPIITPTTSRFIRSGFFNSINNPNESPSEQDFNKLFQFTSGCQLGVLSEKEMSVEQEKVYLAELSMEQTVAVRGRKKETYKGYKKGMKIQWRGLAIEMRKSGLSYMKIARGISKLSGFVITDVTVMNWVKSK